MKAALLTGEAQFLQMTFTAPGFLFFTFPCGLRGAEKWAPAISWARRSSRAERCIKKEQGKAQI